VYKLPRLDEVSSGVQFEVFQHFQIQGMAASRSTADKTWRQGARRLHPHIPADVRHLCSGSLAQCKNCRDRIRHHYTNRSGISLRGADVCRIYRRAKVLPLPAPQPLFLRSPPLSRLHSQQPVQAEKRCRCYRKQEVSSL
jgi:hypothetical protein